jgi:four helix bundle protein
MMYAKPHKNLDAWKKSFDLVIELYRVTRQFPAEEKFGLTSQIRRAAVSVPANIAEGAGRKSPKEFVNFLSIALGSIAELDTLLLLCLKLDFLPEKETEFLTNELNVIGKLVYGLMKKLGYISE